MTPIACCIQIAKRQHIRHAQLNACNAVRDFAGHEFDSTQGTLVIEQDTATRMKIEAFAVVYGHPVSVELGDSIRTTGMECCAFRLPQLLNQPKHLRR